MQREYWVYIMTNERNTVLYTGVTSNLSRRVEEPKSKKAPGFTKKYNISKLVFAEAFETADDAIFAEKKIKSGSRQRKIDLYPIPNLNACRTILIVRARRSKNHEAYP